MVAPLLASSSRPMVLRLHRSVVQEIASTSSPSFSIPPSSRKPHVAPGPSRGFTSSTPRRATETRSASSSGRDRSSSSSSNDDNEKTNNNGGGYTGIFNSTGAETALGASAGVILLGLAGLGYNAWYKEQVVRKMEKAFDAGYDPVLALVQSGEASNAKEGQLAHVRVDDRLEDDLVRRILRGEERGRYFLILGPKGSGKTTSLIQAMADQSADGVAFFEGHSDPSIVVDRFSESINYSLYRDYLGNLVGLSDLQNMSTFQNLERALHKLEAALIRRRKRTGKPAVIIMNGAHLLGSDEEGTKILTVLQQRAEKWASAGTCTFVFTSNDYFIYDLLRRHSNRMDTMTFKDLSKKQSLQVLRSCRQQYWDEDPARQDPAILESVYRITGGRLSLLNKIARRKNMLRAANQLIEDDMQFLLSKTGIIVDHDDDVMDEQKWSTCSWLLFKHLAERQQALEEEEDEKLIEGSTSTSKTLSDMLRSAFAHGHSSDGKGEREQVAARTTIVNGYATTSTDTAQTTSAANRPPPHVTESPVTDPSQDLEPDIASTGDVPNPSLTWGEARQVMTRPDFILQLDHLNLIHIDKHHHIRADSMPLLRAFRKVTEEEGYGNRLEDVMDRVSAIESLGRTRELVWKEQGEKGKFLIKKDGKGREMESWTLLGGDERLGREEEDEDGEAD